MGFPILGISLVALSCGTEPLPDSFALKAVTESFDSGEEVNTKVDILFVVDNSGSMKSAQQKLREGFKNFAATYMKSDWDIQLAVIPTDTYVAHPAFQTWRNAVASGSSGFISNYIRSFLTGVPSGAIPVRNTPFVNPAWNPSLVNLTPGADYGRFTNGYKQNERTPSYGPDYGKLLPGNHDGPISSLCVELNTWQVHHSTACWIRDDGGPTGPEKCANPGVGETWSSQCVNTPMNDTVRTGKPVLKTIPPAGVTPNALWTQQLVDDFLVNVALGTNGQGSERGLASVKQLLDDNEVAGSAHRLFRPGSLRVIVLVGDEDDQSMTYPASPAANWGPSSGYTGSCTKSIDGTNFLIPNCPSAASLIPVSTFKEQYDNFFRGLDGSGVDGNPNYFVVSIVASTAASVTSLRNSSGFSEIDRADRFIALGNLVGNGSLVGDLGDNNFSSLFDSIGQTIVAKKAAFTLSRAPRSDEDIVVTIVRAGGGSVVVSPSKYSVAGTLLTITDQATILSLGQGDKISITYNPKSVN
jgi:hypothetical protein